METIGIGIGSDYNLRVADIIDTILDSERGHNVVKLLVLIKLRTLITLNIERLSPESKDCLRIWIAAL